MLIKCNNPKYIEGLTNLGNIELMLKNHSEAISLQKLAI